MGKVAAEVAGIFASAFSRLFAEEVTSWIPWLNERLLRRAIGRLPVEQRERYAEEWRCYINDLPGQISKLTATLGLFSAARRMSRIASRGAGSSGNLNRTLEISLSAILLVFFAPLLVATALVIKVQGSTKVLYRLRRVGLNGRTFWMYHLGLPSVEVLKQPSEQKNRRLTYLGCFLWRAGLHELPALINVMRGEMSLVGPTAHSPEEVERLSKRIPGYAARQQPKPGANLTFLSGLAYLSGPADRTKRP